MKMKVKVIMHTPRGTFFGKSKEMNEDQLKEVDDFINAVTAGKVAQMTMLLEDDQKIFLSKEVINHTVFLIDKINLS